MAARLLSATVLSVVLGIGTATAQVAGPAELPPESFGSQEYVDSTGCAFLRASIGGRVTWVPRLDSSRQPVCGLDPSLPAAVAAAPVSVPLPASVGDKAPPRQPVRAVSTPQAAPAASVAAVPRNLPVVAGAPQAVQQAVPHGWRPAWQDGRLNPQRGVGTAQGEAQMRLIWSNTVPSVLIDAATGRPVTAREARDLGITLPYGGSPQVQSANPSRVAAAPPSAVAAGRYVQVATFVVAANARRTADNLRRSGLPVRVGHTVQGGRAFQVVMAGPFSADADARTALALVRDAGFSDAFIR